MASTALAEHLSCPVCYDTFRNPVVLSCSHSFCKTCLEMCWRTKEGRECPLCRKSSSEPLCNLVLKNLCESFSKESDKTVKAESTQLCSLHRERLKLFCMYDGQLACVICQTSRKHKNHRFVPADEAAHDKRVDLKAALKILKEKLQDFKQAKETCDQEIQHIETQAERAEKQIKKDFETLHQFLRNEEATRIAALRKEERKKSQAVQNMALDINRKIMSLTDDISALSEEMKMGDISFLQNIKTTMKRSQYSFKDPHLNSGALIDVVKHLGNLKFRVWDNMQDIVQYTPVILDPNTAHPNLYVYKDLTTLRYRDDYQQLPDNPERFSSCAAAVSSVGFSSGKHCWEVEVGDCADWLVGVTTTPKQRNGKSVWKGIYGICCRKGKCGKYTSSESLPLFRRQTSLSRLRVKLDFFRDMATVEFSDSLTNNVLHEVRCTFTERVYPFFYTASGSGSLRILPVECSVTVES